MITTYRLHINELTIDLLNSIKEAFKDKTVEIVVTDELTNSGLIREYISDENSFDFWKAGEEDLYEDYHKKKTK